MHLVSLRMAAIVLVTTPLCACGGNSAGGTGGTSGEGEEPEGQGLRPRTIDFGAVVEKAEGSAASDQPTRLAAGGAVLEIPAGVVDVPTAVRLVRAAAPASAGRPPIGDVFYLASETRPLIGGPFTLIIPASAGPAGAGVDVLRLYLFSDGQLFPIAASRDASGAFVVQQPEVTLLTTPADPRRSVPARTSTPPTAQSGATGPEAPVGGYAVGAPPVPPPPPTCASGAVGEVHEEPGHVFKILVKAQTTCDLVRFVSTTLQEAADHYNKSFTRANGDAPFKHLTPQNRMAVHLGPYADNGEYQFLSWNGYVEVGVVPATMNRAGLRETLFHEMFHAVQDAYSNMFVGGVAAMWWYESTAEWAGLVARGLGYEAAVNQEIELYPELLSVPIQKSRSYRGGLLSYGYSLLVHDVESRSAGYVRTTLHGWSTRSGALYDGLVQAGGLAQSYPAFVTRTMTARLGAGAGVFWTAGRIFEGDSETRVFRRPSKAIGEATETPERLQDEEKRYGVLRFAFDLGPLTTRFVQVHSNPLGEPRRVKVGVLAQGTPSDHGLVAAVRAGRPAGGATVTRVSASGTTIEALGTTHGEVWVAAFNPDTGATRSYEVLVNLLRPSLSDPLARCRAREYEAAFRLYKLEGRSDGDAYIVTASCAFAFGDYAAAEMLAVKGASASSGGGRAHNYFIAEYAAEKQGKSGASYGASGIAAAKQSGMCMRSNNPEFCAEIYRESVRGGLDEQQKKLAGTTPPPPMP